jgi:hypothetical protein
MSTKAGVGVKKRHSRYVKLPRMYDLRNVDKCQDPMGGWVEVVDIQI